MLSYLLVRSRNALTVKAKANHSREKQSLTALKQIAHGKSKSLTAKATSLGAKANQLRMRYSYSGGQSVQYHSTCFPLTLASRVTADKRTRTHLLGDFIPTDKYGAYWLLLVSADVILN